MAVEVKHNPDESRFEIFLDGELAGFSAYRPEGDARAFTHTEIDERFSGEGLGSHLIRSALDASAEAGLQILPYCGFVRAFIEKNLDYSDLVPEDKRKRFRLS